MAKKKKLKQAGQRKDLSEEARLKTEQTVSDVPANKTELPSVKENGSESSVTQHNGCSEDNRQEVTNVSTANTLKRQKEKPSSSSMAEGSVEQGSEGKPALELKSDKDTAGIQGSKNARNTDQKKAGVTNRKQNISKDASEMQGGKKTLLAKQTKQKKEMAMGKLEQRLSMRKKKIKDPRLIPRMKKYLESRPNKNFVSIPQMAEYLQDKYPEYGRKKKNMFIQYVDKAYTFMEKPSYNDPPPPLSDTDENSNTEKELVEENGHYVWKNVSEHSKEISDVEFDGEDGGDEVTVDNDSYSSSEDVDEEMENLVEYKDSNAINNRLMNMYKNSPTHVSKSAADDKKRKTSQISGVSNTKKSKSESKVLYPSPYVLERNMSSTGIVGPRRTPSDKFFIDRKGDGIGLKKDSPESKESREVTIQKFLGNLPSRTSFGSYVSGKSDPRLKGGSLYRVYSGKEETEQEARLNHSGITPDNVGVTNHAPKSPISVQSEDSEVVVLDDPRRKQEIDITESVAGVGEDRNSRGKSQGKEKIPRTPKKKKNTSKLRKQDDSDSESGRKETGLAVQKSSVTFADVGGNEANLTEICKLLVHMRHPEVYQRLGVTPPRGFLLHGPPGCGKTLLANAIAGELDLAMIKIAATEIVSGVSGNSEEKIRELFDKATQSAPCVVFIDEIDAITPKRETASKDMERRIVAQLLACMDDLNANPSCHVLVIGATNRPDSLDPALRRAGRFDREICLGIPDEQSRLRILQVLCRNLQLAPGFDFNYIAHNTPGYVGADLMALAREAAMTAVNRVFQDLQSGTSNTVEDGKFPTSEVSVSSSQNITDIPCSQHGPISDLTEIGASPNTVLSGTTSGKNQSSISDIQSTPNLDVTQSDTYLNEGRPGTSKTQHKPGSTLDCEKNLLWASKADKKSVDISNDKLQECDVNHQIDNDVTVTEVVNKNLKSDSRTTEDIVTVSAECTHSVNNNEIIKATDDEVTEKGSLGEIITVKITDDEVIEKGSLGESQMEVDSEHTEKCQETSEETTELSEQKSAVVSGSEYASVLSWLKEHPPLTEEQLADLFISMEDFKEALKYVQPSAKREGFATIPDVTWDDIGALHEVREELQLAILAPVRHPEEFKSLGLTRAQGVLLAGPPGCGKTLLAKAVANESGINFISVKGPELLNMYVGESERAVRTVFQRARNSAPCVIFFDELDALCPRRSGHSEGNSSARVVNQLLTEMDGLEERKQVFIMAATNRPDIIDPAVLRPGRLDKILYVGLPTTSDRLDILTCITKDGNKPKLADDVSLTSIAEDKRCDCYTGADLAALVREASITALKETISTKDRQSGSMIIVKGEHFNSAFRKIKPSVTPKDQERYDSMRSKLAIGT